MLSYVLFLLATQQPYKIGMIIIPLYRQGKLRQMCLLTYSVPHSQQVAEQVCLPNQRLGS